MDDDTTPPDTARDGDKRSRPDRGGQAGGRPGRDRGPRGGGYQGRHGEAAGGGQRYAKGPPNRRAKPAEAAEDMTRLLFGIHAIEAALRNPARVITRLHLTENAERRLAPAFSTRSVPIERVSPRDLDRRLGADTVHQGALAEVEPLAELQLSDLDDATGALADGPLLVLDQVTDPHNVGAILRSAAVFGARAVITTRRHSPPASATLAKSASGALEAIPMIMVQTLGDSLEELAGHGYRIIGLDGDAPGLLEDADLTGPVALVLGAEGKGLRARTREVCHVVCSIVAAGPLDSLNVSNAAAVALHLAAMQRRKGRA